MSMQVTPQKQGQNFGIHWKVGAFIRYIHLSPQCSQVYIAPSTLLTVITATYSVAVSFFSHVLEH